MPHHLISLTGVTNANVGLDRSSDPRPLVVLGHEGLGPGHAVVPRERGVEIVLEDLQVEGSRAWVDEEAALGVEEAPRQQALI